MTRQTPLAPPAAIGFVGLGDQGLPMAVAIAEAGFELHVWARRADSLAALRSHGVGFVGHQTLSDLAPACELVAVCVSTDADTATVADGLFPGLAAGAVLVDHGTGTPTHAVALAERGAEHGVAVLDAPVSGGRPGAETRTLTALIGGDTVAVERARTVLETFSAHAVHLGGHGAGQTAKLLNNALLMLNQAAVADVFALAAEMGLASRPLQEVLSYGSGSSAALTLFGSMITSSTVEHLSAVQTLDMDLFDAAVRDAGADPGRVSERARRGAARMAEVVARLGA